LTNDSKQLAFFVNPQLTCEGEEVLPAFWSANYVSLAPGESITLTVNAPNRVLSGKNQEILIEGCNIEKQILKLQ
jgi:hypothetical protein